MKKLSILLLALAAWGAAIGQTLITGQVTDETGNPLIGTNVYLVETRQGGAADATGLYKIENVGPGKFTLEASYLGYQKVRLNTVVKEGLSRLVIHIQLKERLFEIDELLVQAVRANDKTPMTYTNIEAEEIETRNMGQDVPYLLRWTPSAVVTSDAGTGIGYTGIRIRGTDPTRINVTINGIPLNDSESQGVFWVDLPDFISSTNDIQIQRGAGTSTNGAGAFGATINLNTVDFKEEAYAQVSGSVGTFNTRRGSIQFGSGLLNERFTIDGRLSKINSDGYIDRGSADLSSWFLSAAYKGKSSMLRLNAFSGHEVTYQAWNGVPEEFIDDEEMRTFNSAGTEKPGEPHDNEVDDYRQTHYQALYNNQINPNWNLNLALHYTKGAGFFEQYKAGEDFEDYGLAEITSETDTINTTDLIRRRWLDNDFYGTTYSLNYLSNDNKLELTLGGAYNIYEGKHFGEVIWARNASDSEIGQRYYDNDAEKKDFNIFGKVNYELAYGLNAYLDLQYRSVNYEFLGYNNDLQNVDQTDQLNFFNPKLGLFYQLKENTSAYVSFAVANREPNRNDYTENPESSRPRPERLLNTELGLRQNWKKSALGINFYHMAYQDQLALNGQINDVGEAQRINIDNSYRLGVELVGGIELADGLDFNANLTLSTNKVEQFTEFVDTYDSNFSWLGQTQIVHEDTDLAFSPSVIAGGELAYELMRNKENQHLSISLLAKYVGKQFIDNTSDENNVIDAYFFTDLKLSYAIQSKLFEEIGINLMVRNVFDSLFETNAWSYRYIFDQDTTILKGFYPQASRNFLVGMNVRF